MASTVGRLIQTVSNGTAVQYSQFDPNGRVLQHSQSNPQMNSGNPAQFSYVYNVAGGLTNIVYPSGRSITTGYDNAGRAAAVSGSMGGTARNYAGIASGAGGLDSATCTQCIQYAPHGGLSQSYLSQGSGGQWAIKEEHGHNGRLQPTSIASTLVSTNQTIRSLTFGYAAGQQSDGADNNGNLLSQTIAGSGLTAAVTQTYAYDGVNRITRASEGACSPLQGFSYDTWGNGWVSSYTQSSGCPSPQPNTPVANVYDAATHHSSVNYATWDAAGRQESVGGYVFTYDAENRMISATLNSTTVYQYDGDGRRVAKINNCPGTGTCTPATLDARTVWYVYDAAGNLATEYGQSTMASALPCTTCYLMQDHLGSTRVMIDQNGNAVTGGCHDYLPFGQEIISPMGQRSTSCYPTNFKSGVLFTGQLRDAEGESGFDYFGARYYSGTQGRFTSPDPVFFQAGMLTDPQRFTLYAYVRNNPLRYLDPKGEAIELTGTDEERAKKLAAIQSVLGEAGKYLYDNVYKGKHYVGIYTNGQDGKEPAFASINGATKVLSQIVSNNAVATINFAQEGTKLVSGNGRVLATIGSIDIASGKGPGSTRVQGDGTISTTVLAPGLNTGVLPGPMMSNGAEGQQDAGLVLWHELGHVLGIMSGEVGPQTDSRAIDLENTVRRLKNPSAPVRMLHDPPPGVR